MRSSPPAAPHATHAWQGWGSMSSHHALTAQLTTKGGLTAMPKRQPADAIDRLPNKAERKTIEANDKARRTTESLMTGGVPLANGDPTTKKQRFSRRKVSTKRTLATATVDPAKLAAYLEQTKRDANRNARYSPPIINHKLCK